MIEIKVDEKKQELKEKIIKEFLEVMDFELVGINKDSIVICDKNNKEDLEVLDLPKDFYSEDNLRTFRCSRLDASDYSIKALNAKYPKQPFTKNGISGIDLTWNKEREKDYFLSQLFFNEKLYTFTIGNDLLTNYLGYRVNNEDGITDFDYEIKDDNRKLRIINHQDAIEKSICIQEKHINNKHTAVLKIEENHQEIYSQELEENEIEVYFRALAYKANTFVQNANNVLRTLNCNLYNVVFSYYPITYRFMELMENACSDETVEQLYEEYMNFDGVKRTLKDKSQTDKKDI